MIRFILISLLGLASVPLSAGAPKPATPAAATTPTVVTRPSAPRASDAVGSRTLEQKKTVLSENEKIEALLTAVRDSHLTFTRNGTPYPSDQAADHLRQKWDYAGKRIKTARQFIDRLASESSVSHTPYTLTLANGSTIPSRDWLYHELERIEAAHQANPR